VTATIEAPKKRHPLVKRFLLFAAVVGPGIITANVDNDAGGITTYSISGASFGYSLLWSLIPITIALMVVQEMAARLGVYTGKGFADLIREKWGIRTTFYLMIVLLVVNFANTLAEFAGWAASLEIFGVSKYVSVPIGAFVVWLLVARGNYKVVEKIFLIATTVYITYIASGLMAKPDWAQAGREILAPPVLGQPAAYWICLVGVIGTTIAPWMQFYQQSSVVEKGIRPKDYKLAAIDTIVGCAMAVIVATFITFACAATRGGPVRHRTRERVPVRRVHPAAVHRVHHLRGHGLGGWRLQVAQAGSGVPRHLHGHDRPRRGDHPDPRRPAHPRDLRLPGHERRAHARDRVLRPQARQRPPTHRGRGQLEALQRAGVVVRRFRRRRLGHHGHGHAVPVPVRLRRRSAATRAAPRGRSAGAG
jgi:hypothetical protein